MRDAMYLPDCLTRFLCGRLLHGRKSCRLFNNEPSSIVGGSRARDLADRFLTCIGAEDDGPNHCGTANMYLPHPYRYQDGFRGQLSRLESLCQGVTTGAQREPPREFIALEHRGANTLDIARYSGRLRHVECLIADWVTDGSGLRFAEVESDFRADAISEFIIPDAPSSTTFVAFEPNGFLDLESQPRSRIDGFYVREIASEGKAKAELTFVCAEPGWQAMHLCLYSDAMEIGSRIAIAEIPVGEPIAVSDLPRLITGNTTLARDPALVGAVCAAAEFLENVFATRHVHAQRFQT